MEIAAQNVVAAHDDLAGFRRLHARRAKLLLRVRAYRRSPLVPQDPEVDHRYGRAGEQATAVQHRRAVLGANGGEWDLGDWLGLRRAVDGGDLRVRRDC